VPGRVRIGHDSRAGWLSLLFSGGLASTSNCTSSNMCVEIFLHDEMRRKNPVIQRISAARSVPFHPQSTESFRRLKGFPVGFLATFDLFSDHNLCDWFGSGVVQVLTQTPPAPFGSHTVTRYDYSAPCQHACQVNL
jgi:hypothetical protein